MAIQVLALLTATEPIVCLAVARRSVGRGASEISRSANLISANTIFVEAFVKERLKPGVSVLFVKQDARSSTSPKKQASEERNKPLKKA